MPVLSPDALGELVRFEIARIEAEVMALPFDLEKDYSEEPFPFDLPED